MDDFQAKQEDELMVLQSIYSSNFVDLREVKHGKKKPNPIFKITLFPMNSESQHELNHFYVQIDLKIKFGPNYPNEPPGIILENDKGLSVEQVRSLHKQLTNKAQDLKGSEMVYQLSQIVSEFLYANNKPPTKSFYEQRMENKFQVEMQKLQESYYEIENSKIDEQLVNIKLLIIFIFFFNLNILSLKKFIKQSTKKKKCFNSNVKKKEN